MDRPPPKPLRPLDEGRIHLAIPGRDKGSGPQDDHIHSVPLSIDSGHLFPQYFRMSVDARPVTDAGARDVDDPLNTRPQGRLEHIKRALDIQVQEIINNL